MQKKTAKKQGLTVPTLFYLRAVMMGGKHGYVKTYLYHSFRGFSGSLIATNRDEAKKKIRKIYGDADFWR